MHWSLNSSWFLVLFAQFRFTQLPHAKYGLQKHSTFESADFRSAFCSQYFQSRPQWRGICFCCVGFFTVWEYIDSIIIIVTCTEIRVCRWKVGKSLKGRRLEFCYCVMADNVSFHQAAVQQVRSVTKQTQISCRGHTQRSWTWSVMTTL